jgi:hypothetical protein
MILSAVKRICLAKYGLPSDALVIAVTLLDKLFRELYQGADISVTQA